VARRPSRAEAGPGLDDRGQALSALLPSVLQALDVSFGTAFDEVAVVVEPGEVEEVCRRAREHPALDFDYLRSLSVVDYVERLEVNYHLLSLSMRHKMVVKTNLPPDDPRVPTVTGVWRGANWYEREGHDLFGVVFEGHPDLSPLLLYEGFEGHPGLKSFPFHEYDEW
jgi:NADH-quinone oxidoreductase subunit C